MIRRIIKIKLNDNGFVMPLALAMIALLSIAGVALLELGLSARRHAAYTTTEIYARTAADAGLTKALFEMNEKLKADELEDSVLPHATNATLANCDATFSYTITEDLSGGYTIESVGSSGISVKRVFAGIGLHGLLFDHAILTRASVILKPDVTIDGYNSKNPGKEVKAKIATISSEPNQIILSPNVTIDGDVYVGVGGDPDTVIDDQGATTGDRLALTVEPDFPEVTVPDIADMGTDLYTKSATLTIGPDDSGTYNSISVLGAANPGILIIDGGDVVLHSTGDIEIGQGCEVFVAEGSSLTLYAGGDIVSRNDSSISYGGDPQQPQHLQIFSTCTSDSGQIFDIKAKSDWTGTIYAPYTDMVLRAHGDVFGAFVANNFEYKADGDFYYDEALEDDINRINDGGVSFVVEYWSEED